MDAKQRRRIHGSISDICMLELWLAGEGEAHDEELADAFSRIQARMLVVQAILWPSDDSDDDGLDGDASVDDR